VDLLQRDCKIGESHRTTLPDSLHLRLRNVNDSVQVSGPVLISKGIRFAARRTQRRKSGFREPNCEDIFESFPQFEILALYSRSSSNLG
jgi:hypothetical protein